MLWPDRWAARLRRGTAGRPVTSFFLCGTPRTGTSYLAALLASSERVGLAREYFGPDKMPALAVSDCGAYVSDVVSRSQRRGVFGAKLFWSHLERLLPRLRAAVPDADVLSDRDVLGRFFPSARYIWIRRADVVAQAVSWHKAEETGRWNSFDVAESTLEPTFDFDAIHDFVRIAELRNESWHSWFAANGIEWLPIAYEELAADPVAVTRRALEFLEVSIPRSVSITTWFERQADEVNSDWIARYRSLAPTRSAGRPDPGVFPADS